MGASEMPASTTARADEIRRFDDLAATWWDPHGPMWPLHRLNALRVPYIVAGIAERMPQVAAADHSGQGLSGLSVLDVGCAAGLLSEAMAVRGARVTGVDPSTRNVEAARRHAQQQGLQIEYLAGPVERVRDRQFDVVLNMEVVEHVDDLPAFLDYCCTLTRPGGMQFVSTINRTPLAFLTAIVGAEYLLGWLPRGTHRWRQFVKPAELEAHLADNGCRVVERAGVRINPITRRFSLTRFEGVNYMLSALRDF